VVLLIKARPGLGRPGTDNDQRDFEADLPVLSASSAHGSRTRSKDTRGRRASTGRQRS